MSTERETVKRYVVYQRLLPIEDRLKSVQGTDVVLATDYDALQQRCEALERERDVLRGEIVEAMLTLNPYVDGLPELQRASKQAVQQLAAAQQRVTELEQHERQTHERLGAILGTDDSLEEKAKQLQQTATGLREALTWIINLHHGVSRFAGDGFHHGVMPVEWQDAIKAGRQALAPQQAQRVVGGEEAVQHAWGMSNDLTHVGEQLQQAQQRVGVLEASQRRTPLESETVCHTCDGSGWVER